MYNIFMNDLSRMMEKVQNCSILKMQMTIQSLLSIVPLRTLKLS